MVRIQSKAEALNRLEFGAFIESANRAQGKILEADEMRAHLIAALARLTDAHNMCVQTMMVLNRRDANGQPLAAG